MYRNPRIPRQLPRPPARLRWRVVRVIALQASALQCTMREPALLLFRADTNSRSFPPFQVIHSKSSQPSLRRGDPFDGRDLAQVK